MILPGQSLTAEPKNAPYENPPEMTDPEDAITWHLGRLSEPKRMNALLDTLELGMDVVTLTEGLLRGAVLDGRHNIDVSLIVAPVIHELINSTAMRAGLDFDEGVPDDTEKQKKIQYQINSRKARKMIAESKGSKGEMPKSVQATVDSVPTKEDVKGVVPKGEGLMTRKPKEGAQ